MARDKRREKVEITSEDVGSLESLGITEGLDQTVPEEPTAPAAPEAKAVKVVREPEISLQQAVHSLIDDSRWKTNWEATLRKHATSHGLGETATATRWKACIESFGLKTK